MFFGFCFSEARSRNLGFPKLVSWHFVASKKKLNFSLFWFNLVLVIIKSMNFDAHLSKPLSKNKSPSTRACTTYIGSIG